MTIQNHKIPYVFLTSHAYSGSTLSSFLLGTHPEIATVGELKGPAYHLDLASYRCSCGNLFQECPFWLRVTDVVNRHGLNYALNQYLETSFELGGSNLARRLRTKSLRNNGLEHLRDSLVTAFWPGHRQAMKERLRRNEVFAQAILEVSGKSVFLDATKDPMRIRYLRASDRFDFFVIHLVRDVRGVVRSIMTRRPEMTVKQATRHWLQCEQNIKRHLAEVPAERQLFVRYEDLASDTLVTLNKIFSFLGLPHMQDLSNYRQVEYHIMGNKMRKLNNTEIRKDERWRTYFSESQLRTIHKLVNSGSN
ncbi:MAG: sulfotransferase [Anaerolineaceae bacterium]|nr:sulfotransferase [Anaerolineaceae bacterium]